MEDEAWECPVCLERMREIAFPLSAPDNPCTHSFCVPCSQDLQNQARLKAQPHVLCPLCRRQIHAFMVNHIASEILIELDKCKELLRDAKDKERDTHKRERKLAQDNNAVSLRAAQLEGELAKAESDRQCEIDRNDHLKKIFSLVEMEKDTLADRLSDLQRKLQAELEESTRRISIMEGEVVEYQNQLRISTEETAKSEMDKQEIRAQMSEVENRLSQALEDKRALEARASELEHCLALQGEELKRVQADHEASQDDLRNKLHSSMLFEKRSRDLELKASQLESEVRRTKDEMQRVDRRAFELDASVKKSENERVGAGQIVLQLEAMLSTYKDEVKHLEREKYEVTKKSAELEGTLVRMKSDASKFDEERVSMKERVWRAERDMEVMKLERDKMRALMKEKEDRQNDTYLSGWMKNLKPLSTAIWGDNRIYGPLVKNSNDFAVLERRGGKKDGRVWRCKSKSTANVYALKTLSNTPPQNAQGSTDLTIFREAMLLNTMEHPNIITLDGMFRDAKGQLNLLLSPFVDIDLDYSVGQRSMNALEIKTLIHQLLLAVSYMHKQDIVHRNIKPSNILRFEDYTLKLSGFSYARSIQNQTIDMITPKSPLWFVAPEVLQAQGAIDWKAVDVWSIGCVFAEMILQKPLFVGTSDTYNNICTILGVKEANGKLYPNVGSTLPSILSKSPYSSHPSFRAASSLIQQILSFEPSRRITASQALQHEYFSDLNSQKETSKTIRDISKEAQDMNLSSFVDDDCAGIL